MGFLKRYGELEGLALLWSARYTRGLREGGAVRVRRRSLQVLPPRQ